MRRDEPPRHIFRQPNVVGERVEATVKWFDPVRGFGFVQPSDGSPDALIPNALVQSSGHDALPDGTTVVVDIIEGRKGNQVSALHSVDTSTAKPSRPRGEGGGRFGDRGGDRFGNRGGDRGPRPAGPRRPFDTGPTTEAEGTVKWFNGAKGFGFISPDGGGRDVFVHIKALERSGLSGLNENQRVRLTIRQGEKGPEAVSVATI
ncbi:MAG TPA: cold shock domain-containing protein [Azospirillum sp.]|nr:cold shock domain-containing protein [Azospirillum sp.]